jgi:hypothetical protein
MAIKVTRNDAGNCITFVGSTNPVYWNSCLEGEINEDNSNNVNVVNKIRTVEEGVTIYEFFNLPYTDFQDKDGNDFVSPSDCAEYITANANVLSNTGTFIFSQTDLLDAQRDATDTTVLFSNGDIFAVNSLTASSQADGTIKISTVRGNKDIYTHLRYYNVSVLDGAVTGFNTIDAAVDRLNEVLGGTTVGSNTGTTQTTVTTTDSSASFTVYGDRITETGSGTTLGYTSTAEAGNFDTSNGLYSNETISANGEYFEFEQDSGDWTNSRGVYIGLFDETTYDVADLDVDVAGSAVKGLLYLRLYPTPFTFADATNGAGKINEAGFSNSPQTKTKFRLGRDNDGRVYIAHETSTNVFEVICRSESVVAADTELRMFAIMPLANQLNGIRNMTVNEAVLGASVNWHYIESPDGEFYYPLFSAEDDAISIDELYGTAADGAGAAHQHTFADELPSAQTWYMPNSYMFHAQSAAPTAPVGIAWNEIQTGDDANYVPSQFSQSVTVSEGDNINLQIKPAGDSNTYNLSNVPAGLAYNSVSGYLQGTAPEVTGNNVDNPSDLYSITVTKANSYGSSVGSLELTVSNTTAPAVAISGFTHISGSTSLVDSNTLDDGSAVTLDDLVGNGNRLKITDAWITANVLPFLTAAEDKIFIGFSPTPTVGWNSISVGDFNCGFRFQYNGPTSVKVAAMLGGTSMGQERTHSYSTNLGYDFYISNKDGVCEANYNLSSTDKSSELTVADGGSFTYSASQDTGITGDKTVVIGVASTTADISASGISEHTLPVPSTNSTSWTKALDFSGSSQHAKMVSSSLFVQPLQMGGLANLADLGTSSQGSTSNHSSARPWATAVVFKSDGYNGGQFIWNQGEGDSSSSNDNISLFLDGSGNLTLAWGRGGDGYNQCRFATNISSSNWYGVSIAYNGVRLGGNNASAANLADCFDIRLMSSADSFNAVGNNLSTSSNWINTGVRMDRTFAGDFTIGGKGASSSFRGKVASMIVTPLLQDVGYSSAQMPEGTMVGADQAKMMITDPVQWVADYRSRLGSGNPSGLFRKSAERYATNYFTFGGGYQHIQVWLMGDGSNDSYSNGIRNYINPSDQNYTKLQLNSMQANDIETVNIAGLT